jgi:hypothetical protein
MSKKLKPGYILHSDPAWLDYHLRHSAGRSFGYSRRVGAPMRNVVTGGFGFFLRRMDRVKTVFCWGNFSEDIVLTPTAAWKRFGTSLGAPRFRTWIDTFDVLRGIGSNGSIRVLRFDNLVVPRIPVVASVKMRTFDLGVTRMPLCRRAPV